MAIHALIETDTLTDRGNRKDFAGVPNDLLHKKPPVKWVPLIVNPPEIFDPATEKLVFSSVVTLTEVTDSMVATALTQEELDDIAIKEALDEVLRLAELGAEPDDSLKVGGKNSVRVRALIELFNKRDNYLTNRIAELQAGMDAMKASSGAVANLRAAIPASWLGTATRTKADAIADYKADIAAGNQNT